MTWIATGVSLGTAALSARQGGKAADEIEDRNREIDAAERDRQNRIDTTVQLINQAYDSPEREQQYVDFMTNLRGFLGGQLTEQKSGAARQRKFAVARTGQTGGSFDRDTRRTLGDEFADAALDVETRVQDRGFALRDMDEQQRQNLIRLARGGLDTTTAVRRTGALQQADLGRAMTAGQGETLGDVFGQTLETSRGIREREERARNFGYDAGRQNIYGGN